MSDTPSQPKPEPKAPQPSVWSWSPGMSSSKP